MESSLGDVCLKPGRMSRNPPHEPEDPLQRELIKGRGVGGERVQRACGWKDLVAVERRPVCLERGEGRGQMAWVEAWRRSRGQLTWAVQALSQVWNCRELAGKRFLHSPQRAVCGTQHASEGGPDISPLLQESASSFCCVSGITYYERLRKH